VCLICGKKQKLLKRHLAVEHELTPNQYREAFELRPDYPMVPASYAQQRRDLARRLGLGQPARGQRKGGRPTSSRGELLDISDEAGLEVASALLDNANLKLSGLRQRLQKMIAAAT
jgi:hypothetical protein